MKKMSWYRCWYLCRYGPNCLVHTYTGMDQNHTGLDQEREDARGTDLYVFISRNKGDVQSSDMIELLLKLG